MDTKRRFTHKFTPLVARGADAEFDGTMTLYVPSVGEQMKLVSMGEYDLEAMSDQIAKQIEVEEAEEAAKESVDKPAAKAAPAPTKPAAKKTKEQKVAERIEAIKASRKNVPAMADLLDKIGPFVAELNLTHKATGELFKDWDEFYHNPLSRPICIELYGMFIRGFAPSKNS